MDIVKPFQDAFGTLLNYLPRLIGAIIVLVVGYLVAKLVGSLVSRLLARVGFDRATERAGVAAFLQRAGTTLTPSRTLGKVTFWFVFVITFTMFASALGVPQISGFLNQMLGYIPRIFAAIAILFLAALLANFIAALVRGATDNAVIARITRWAIIVYSAFTALTVLGIAIQLTANTLLIVLAGLALAFGIAFGWGGRDIARNLLHRVFATTADARTTPSDQEPAPAPVAND